MQNTEKTPFRQSMSALHTWGSLIAGWMLFVIFVTGSIGVFDEPVSHWMQPERAAILSTMDYDPASAADRQAAVGKAQSYLQQVEPNGHLWFATLPDLEDPAIKLFWQDADENPYQAKLHPDTGELLPAAVDRDTEGGHHFVHMHFELHSGTLGIWIVGFFTLLMLVALISGVIIHRRIFKDFFTFRSRKGQRSWLDAHNASGVLTLPFQLMIAFTGLAVFVSIYMPAAIFAHYDSPGAFFAEVFERPVPREMTHQAAPVADISQMFADAEQAMGKPGQFIRVEHPGDSSATFTVFGLFDAEALQGRLVLPSSGMAEFDAVTSEQRHVEAPGAEPQGAAFRTQRAMRTLHFANFGGYTVRWLYFLLGMTGAVMIATGSILFMVKRRQRALKEFGHATQRVYRVVDVLNVAAISGLLIACVGYLWINRLLPLEITGRAGWEVSLFFALWAATLLHSALRPVNQAWREQLLAFAALCLLLPFVNAFTVGEHLLSYLYERDWRAAGVELTVIIFGLLALKTAQKLRRKTAANDRQAASVNNEQVGVRG